MGIRGLLVSSPPFHTRIFGTVLALVLFVSGCTSLNRDTGLTAEESLALNLAEQVVHAPYLANEQLQARLAVLKFLGLPYEEMSSLFGDVERQISECMHQMEHTYSPMPGDVASLPVLAFGMSATDHGYFPFPGSAATEIMLGQSDLAAATAIAERGSDSKEYFDALYGVDPEDLTGGCSGKAHAILGLDSFDTILEDAVTRLQAETEKDVVLADLRVRFAACIGAERADYLASLDAVVAATASPIEQSRAISEFAIAELGCSETVLAPSDSVVRERVAQAIREDHQLTHEICRLEDSVGWSIPTDVAKCGHEH